MDDLFYKKIVQQLKTAYAHHKIICSDDGFPCDCACIEVNDDMIINAYHLFEASSGYTHDEFIELISGKKILLSDDSYVFNGVQNITDCKHIEDALVASELRYRRLFESAKDGILILDAESGCIVDVNQFLIDLLGYSKAQFMDKAIWDLGFFSDIIESKDNYLELLKNEYIRYEDIPLRTASGRSIHVEFVSNVYNADKLKVIQCNIRDITERFEAKEALDMSERKFESYIEHAPSAVFITDENGQYIEANRAASEITGYSVEQLLKMTLGSITTEDSLTIVLALFATLRENGKMSGELQFRHKSGLTRWWSIDAVKLSEQRFLVFSNDITDKKKTEEYLLFMGFHDQLTGLYNRRYFENAIVKIDTEDNLPISLIICDINGLKIANDSFGHAVGDALLIHTAKMLNAMVNPGEIVARIGGDEFIVVCPKLNASAAKKKIEAFKSKIANIDVSGLHLSLSFGYETKTSDYQTITEILANAENHMYRHKLFEEASLRSKTIDIIMQTLFEKSDRESQHSRRVSEICHEIASSMNFDEDEIDRIRIAGLVHDIGKIGISENILNKTSSLNEYEWNEVKKHPEVGWRILSAANEFFDLANCVLFHHEKWDGSGYPNGTRHEGIPIEARIISLADAFDAMTNKRSYREAMSEDQAVEEIRQCSGTHFDPEIVDVFVNQVIPAGRISRRIS